MKPSACTIFALLAAFVRCSPYGLDQKPHSDADVESLVSTLASQVTDSTSATEEKHMARAVLSKRKVSQRKPVAKLQDPVAGFLTGGLGKFLGMEASPVGQGREFSTRWKTSGKATVVKAPGTSKEKNAYVRTLTETEDPQIQRWNREQARYAQDLKDSMVEKATPAPAPEVVGPGRAMKVAMRISQSMDDEAIGIPKVDWSMKPRPAALASTNGGKKSNAYLGNDDLAERPEAVNSVTDESYTNGYVNNRYLADLNGPALTEKKPWERHLKIIEQTQQGGY